MPTILTSDQYDPFLPDELHAADRLEHHIDQAEREVLDRYRTRPDADRLDYPLSIDALARPVQLAGYAVDESGNPDPASMDDGLLFALRTVIACVAERMLTAPDTDVQRYRQGEREVEYANRRSLRPTRLFRPLRRYDRRGAWH